MTSQTNTLVTTPTNVREFPNSTETAPTLSSSAMLVELSVSCWTGRKKDKRASQDVTASNGADDGVANVHKKLLADCEELVAIQKFVGNVRNIHYASTLAWSDTGLRLLPTTAYFKYHQQMTELQTEFFRLENIFSSGYDWVVTQAQAKLGSLWVADDYPTVESIRKKFGFRLSYIPLPEAGDFRIDVGNEAMTQIKSEYQAFYERTFNTAMKDVWQRVYDALSRMSERLDYSDTEKKRVFRDTLVSNATDLIDLLDICNVSQDTQMSALKLQLEETLSGVTPDGLRDDEYLRKQTKANVDSIIANLPSLDI
tara:strand:- start:1986 stop:2921 length:936 start_codon:yes stop_codon:yes gene_type:complete